MRFISLGHPFPGCRMADIKILLADDHSLVRASLKSLLADFPGIEVIAEAGNGRGALELVPPYRPELGRMGISMPRLDGLVATRRIVKEHPNGGGGVLSRHATRGNDRHGPRTRGA